jgi:glutathione-independent formaldehyde dehydrogenase
MTAGPTSSQVGSLATRTWEKSEVGAAVDRIKKGDMVCLPFNIGCGFCRNCEAGLTAYCLTCFPGMAGAAYGFAGMGPFNGGQAEYLRVPYGDFNCLRLPPEAKDPEKQLDYVMLSDIFPTGWHATELAGVAPGPLSLFMAPDRLD